MKEEQSIRTARAEMDAAKAQSEKTFSNGPRGRFKLYEKIRQNVSLGTVNAVIIVTAVLIVGFLIYGILTAHPQG